MRLGPDIIERIANLRREIDRLVREAGRDAEHEPSPLVPDIDTAHVVPVAADIFELETTMVFEVELPGVSPGDIEIFVLHDILVIEGTKRDRSFGGESSRYRGAGSDERASFVCMEREFGRFRAVLEIPAAADTSRVTARLANGVLTVTLPKVEERRGRRRKVDVAVPLEAGDGGGGGSDVGGSGGT